MKKERALILKWCEKNNIKVYFDIPGKARIAWHRDYVETVSLRKFYSIFNLDMRQRPWAKTMKTLANKQNRRKSKQFIENEKFDLIPQNAPVVEANPWDWD